MYVKKAMQDIESKIQVGSSLYRDKLFDHRSRRQPLTHTMHVMRRFYFASKQGANLKMQSVITRLALEP